MAYTVELQLVMLPNERQALDAYKAETGASFNFIFDKAIKYFIENSPQDTNEKVSTNTSERKRLLVRLTPDTHSLLENYCIKNNLKMSPTAVKAAISFILNSL